MTLRVLTQQLKFNLINDNAKPDMRLDQGNAAATDTVCCHLTEGFDGARVVRPAFTASLTVPLSFQPSDRARDWTFGFIQLVRIKVGSASYNGRIPQEGNVIIRWNIPPNLVSNLLWDVSTLFAPPPPPWFLFPDNLATLPQVRSAWADHPFLKIPLKTSNSLQSNMPNFLYYLNQEADFFTIFTAQEPAGVLHFISTLFWTLNYELTFVWIRGLATLRKSDSFIDFHGTIMRDGPPADPDVESLLKSLSVPGSREDANTLVVRAIHNSINSRGPNHVEGFGWIPGTPLDFWL
jgi:hypothetical protein